MLEETAMMDAQPGDSSSESSTTRVAKRERLLAFYKGRPAYAIYKQGIRDCDPTTPKVQDPKRTWERHFFAWKNAMRELEILF